MDGGFKTSAVVMTLKACRSNPPLGQAVARRNDHFATEESSRAPIILARAGLVLGVAGGGALSCRRSIGRADGRTQPGRFRPACTGDRHPRREARALARAFRPPRTIPRRASPASWHETAEARRGAR